MNWVTIIWTMVSAACLTLAAMHLLVWFNRRTALANLFFSLSAVATAVLAGFELWMMHAETTGEAGLIIRWGHVSFWMVILFLVVFVQLYTRAGRLWLALAVCGLRTLSLILNFTFTPNLNFREITGLRHVQFFGESVSVAVGIPNPWMLVGQTSLVLFLIFLVDITITLWRRGERRSMVLLSSTMAFFVAASLGQFILGFWGVILTPLTPSLFFMGIVASMGIEMIRDTLRAAQLLDELNNKDKWLDLAADSAGVGLWLWDFKTNNIWATERARIIYGFSLNELISYEKFLAKLHPDDLSWVVQAGIKATQEGANFRHDYRIVMPDGNTRWLKVLANTILTPTGVPERMAGLSIDITEQKQILIELQQKHDELTHLARVSTMGELASTLAHELNQPLGAILRNAEAAELFLQDQSPDLDELRAILADIRKDDRRACDVIDRMRAMMKQRSTKLSLIDLKSLVDTVILLIQPDADKRHVKLVLDIDSNLPPVYGDRVQLQQVLLNLLINALDALDDSLAEIPLVTVSARAVVSTVEVAVRDNGAGIAPDQILRVFDPFFSSKLNGLGIGLSISRGIIEAHGGRLLAQNNANGGATFIISLGIAERGDAE